MAKFKQECIFGIRAVMEAIQDEKEIDKVMFRQGIKGSCSNNYFRWCVNVRFSSSMYPKRCLNHLPGKIIKEFWQRSLQFLTKT